MDVIPVNVRFYPVTVKEILVYVQECMSGNEASSV